MDAHEHIMDKYFNNAGLGCCASRLVEKCPKFKRWSWLDDQEIEGTLALLRTEEPEWLEACKIEDNIVRKNGEYRWTPQIGI